MRNTLEKAVVIALALITTSPLSAASPQQTDATRPTASVNVAAVSALSPFRDILEQYDREIATLQRVRASSAPIAENVLAIDRDALRREGGNADARMRTIGNFQNADQERFIFNRVRNDGGLSSNNNVANDVRLHTLKASSSMQARAKNDLARYKDDLVSQEQSVLRTYALLLDGQTRRAYDAKATALREHESSLAFTLAQHEAGARSQIRMQLQNLALNHKERARLQSELQALDRRDAETLHERRRGDALLLQAAHDRLLVQARNSYADMRKHLEKTDADNVAERQLVATGQMHTEQPPIFPKNAEKGNSLADALRTFETVHQENPKSGATIGAFDQARSRLALRFRTSAAVDASTKRATNEQIASLVRERRVAQQEIAEYVMRVAQKTAERQGLGKAFTSDKAPPGSVDLTPSLLKVESGAVGL